jgi:hypothetical protein
MRSNESARVFLALAKSVGDVERVRSSLYRVIHLAGRWKTLPVPAEKSQISEQHRKPEAVDGDAFGKIERILEGVHDHQARIDPSPQETHRRDVIWLWCLALPIEGIHY